ncbi:MAG: NADP-dependent methylenetetrahydromethanopterin/ methylenetetrahydrofolate dehydrogenase [Isosphaeraceae bacterium]
MTSTRPTILVQLDTDPQPSVFDGIVAVDAGVDHLFRHGGVTPENVRELVYGALFTRGPKDLRSTALFLGGSDVAGGEAVLSAVKAAFFSSFRVSVLFDANGANTTAAAAVLAALKGVSGSLQGVTAAVLGGTGPVGQRVARLLSRQGAAVAVGSRSLDRARSTTEVLHKTTGGLFTPFSTGEPESLFQGLSNASIVVAAGTSGVTLLPEDVRKQLPGLKVAIDLNAVPPLGIEGVKSADKDSDRDGVRVWGALGIGGTKMKIHRAAIQELFQASDKVLDAEEVLEIGRSLT